MERNSGFGVCTTGEGKEAGAQGEPCGGAWEGKQEAQEGLPRRRGGTREGMSVAEGRGQIWAAGDSAGQHRTGPGRRASLSPALGAGMVVMRLPAQLEWRMWMVSWGLGIDWWWGWGEDSFRFWPGPQWQEEPLRDVRCSEGSRSGAMTASVSWWPHPDGRLKLRRREGVEVRFRFGSTHVVGVA